MLSTINMGLSTTGYYLCNVSLELLIAACTDNCLLQRECRFHTWELASVAPDLFHEEAAAEVSSWRLQLSRARQNFASKHACIDNTHT